MAVKKANRQENRIYFLKVNKEINQLIIKLVNSTPKKYRMSYDDKLINVGLDICYYCERANHIKIKDAKTFNKREDYFNDGIASLYFLSTVLDQYSVMLKDNSQYNKKHEKIITNICNLINTNLDILDKILENDAKVYDKIVNTKQKDKWCYYL